MNTEDFVTYEQAVKLKELGFDRPCYCCYKADKLTQRKELCFYANETQWNSAIVGGCKYNFIHISAPTMAQAAKWIREEKNLYVNVWLCAVGFGWVIEKYGNPNYNGTFVAEHDGESGDDEDSGLFTTYEKALSAGIDAAMERIKEKRVFEAFAGNEE